MKRAGTVGLILLAWTGVPKRVDGNGSAPDTGDLNSGNYELLSADAIRTGYWFDKRTEEELEPAFNLKANEPGSRGWRWGEPFPPIWKDNPAFREWDAEIKIENGKKVESEEFPGLFRKRANILCTLVVVGPRVAIGAAHCFSYRATDVHFVRIGARGKCFQHRKWPQDDNDLVLCGFDKPVGVERFESLNTREKAAVGTEVMMMGYGCTGQGGSITDVLRMGQGTVSHPQPGRWPEPNTLYVTSNAARGEAALCKGDSGGPTFRFETAKLGPRMIVGINSRVATHGPLRYSYVTSTGTPDNRDFIETWVKQYNFKVCGVNLPSHKAPCLGF